MLNNLTMARLFRRNMQLLGCRIPLGDVSLMNFSTDVGNVSQLLPTIQPLVSIAPGNVMIHTPEFGEAAATDEALRLILDAARAMAMTATDLLSSPEIAAGVRGEFLKGS
jgi:hypothetical protein